MGLSGEEGNNKINALIIMGGLDYERKPPRIVIISEATCRILWTSEDHQSKWNPEIECREAWRLMAKPNEE